MIVRCTIRLALVTLLATGLVGVAAIPAQAQADPENDPYAPYRFTVGTSPHEEFAPEPQFVIGDDTRKQVLDTTRKLPRRVVHILYTVPGVSEFVCSGALIAPDIVATAAHCLFSTEFDTPEGGIRSTNFRVFPGRASRKSKPFGKCTAANTDAVVPQGWIDATEYDETAASFDFGAVRIDCATTPTTWFDLATVNFAIGQTVKLNSYPHADKPFGTQWKASGHVADVDSALVYYDIDTVGGSSGGAVYNKDLSSCTCIVAIHTIGLLGPGFTINAGLRIVAPVKRFFDAFEAR